MANKRIDELTAKTTIVDADLIPIYDSEEGGTEKTKKITFANAIGYEEGVFTPIAADAVSGGNEGSTGTGQYTKIGRLVHIQLQMVDIDTTGLTAGNSFYIRDLPFVAGAGLILASGIVRVVSVTFAGSINASLNANTDAIFIVESISGGGNTVVLVSDIADDVSDIWIAMTYHI